MGKEIPIKHIDEAWATRSWGKPWDGWKINVPTLAHPRSVLMVLKCRGKRWGSSVM
jgi:hypothetical protein